MAATELNVDQPLGAGEVLATAFREYGRRPLTYVAIGSVEALAGLTTYSEWNIPIVASIAIVAVAFVACFAASVVVASGWSRPEGLARVRNSWIALLGLVLIVGFPATLGRIDALFTLLAIVWLALTAFAIPIVMREQSDERRVAASGMLIALRRSLALSQAAFFHAIGVVLILYVVTVLITSLLAGALATSETRASLPRSSSPEPFSFRSSSWGSPSSTWSNAIGSSAAASRQPSTHDPGAVARLGPPRDRLVAPGRLWCAAHATVAT